MTEKGQFFQGERTSLKIFGVKNWEQNIWRQKKNRPNKFGQWSYKLRRSKLYFWLFLVKKSFFFCFSYFLTKNCFFDILFNLFSALYHLVMIIVSHCSSSFCPISDISQDIKAVRYLQVSTYERRVSQSRDMRNMSPLISYFSIEWPRPCLYSIPNGRDLLGSSSRFKSHGLEKGNHDGRIYTLLRQI